MEHGKSIVYHERREGGRRSPPPKNMRITNYTITLYDTIRDMEIYKKIKNNYQYASAWHKKDIDIETGELKKEHLHILVQLPNARTLESISKELEIEKERIEAVKSKKYMIRYLIHKDQPEKYQYSIEEIETNMEIEKYFIDEKIEEVAIKEVLEYIENKKKKIGLKEVVMYSIENGYYKSIRRIQVMIKAIVEEHNKFYR